MSAGEGYEIPNLMDFRPSRRTGQFTARKGHRGSKDRRNLTQSRREAKRREQKEWQQKNAKSAKKIT
jgi:hypothetical protein